ncbi:MAG: DUF4936 family protein [Burkholderiaceae bacterium]
MSTAAAEVYVYYRLKVEQATAARAAFERARGDAPVRLLQRQDGEPGLLTWMEVYEPGLDALELRIAAALAGFVQGLRHRECFVAL